MRSALFRNRLTLSFIVPLLISLACNSATSGLPDNSEPQKIIIERDTEYGSGTFELLDTKAGLSALSSYTAALTMAFDGNRDSNPEKWSKAYTMIAVNSPLARQWTIEKSGNALNPVSVFMAEMSGLDYMRRGEGACTADLIEQGYSLTDRLEPASFLTAVIGAEEAGVETVNNVEATHYTFDQHALGEDGLTEATGELWVAAEGGYIVKYLLTRKAKADYLGEGLEGTLTLDYELTGVNEQVTLKLPDDCPPGLVDAPVMQDAQNVETFPGRTMYTSPSDIATVTDFYIKTLPNSGWQLEGEPGENEKESLLQFSREATTLMVLISASDSATIVQLMIGG